MNFKLGNRGSRRRRGNNKSLSNVLVGVLIGLVLVLAAFPLIFWNEKRAIETAQSLEEGADNVVSIESDTVDPNHDGDLIHTTGELDTTSTVADPDFPIEEEALVLRREVEMFQWHEESERRDDRTYYTYRTDWSSRVIDSSRFDEPSQHRNPNSMPYDRTVQRANDVTLGAFDLSNTFIEKIANFTDFDLGDDFVDELPDNLERPPHVDGNQLYLGNDPNNPDVGDVRIRFSIVHPHEASIVGEQSGSLLSAYAADAGRDVALLTAGRASADEMFEDAMAENVAITWAVRGGALLAMFLGFVMIFGPISYVARFIPFFGRLIVTAKKMVAFALTLVLGGGAMTFSWLLYRPLIGIPLLLGFLFLGGAAFALAVWMMSRADDEEPAAADGGDIGTI